ncbi:MAG: hypothetical protein J0H40_10695 [Rhizobiales bacterium]|nr:hypothetical protein [Hyphomicrobiales bacterium]
MTHLSDIDSRFDSFLFAQLYEDRETSLSVLSALARLDIDAWQEAADLDGLPRDTAINSLASKIWKTDSVRWSPLAASMLAANLVDLLPSHAPCRVKPRSVDYTNGKFLMWLAYGILWGSIAISGSSSLQLSAASDTKSPAAQHLTVPQAPSSGSID